MTDSTTTSSTTTSPGSGGSTRAGSTRAPTPAAARVTVRLPGPLRGLAGGAGDVVVSSTTVGGAVDDVLGRHPTLRRHLRAESGALREHVNLFLNEDDVRYLQGEDTAVAEGDVVTVVPSIAGG